PQAANAVVHGDEVDCHQGAKAGHEPDLRWLAVATLIHSEGRVAERDVQPGDMLAVAALVGTEGHGFLDERLSALRGWGHIYEVVVRIAAEDEDVARHGRAPNGAIVDGGVPACRVGAAPRLVAEDNRLEGGA